MQQQQLAAQAWDADRLLRVLRASLSPDESVRRAGEAELAHGLEPHLQHGQHLQHSHHQLHHHHHHHGIHSHSGSGSASGLSSSGVGSSCSASGMGMGMNSNSNSSLCKGMNSSKASISGSGLVAALVCFVVDRSRTPHAGPEALLAALTLRRAVRDAGSSADVLAVLLQNEVLATPDSRLRAAVSALATQLILCGPESDVCARVDALVALGSSSGASPDTRKATLKCAKLLALQSKAADSKAVALPQRLSPLFKTALAQIGCEDRLRAAEASWTISVVARAMTLLANTALMHSFTEVPAWWLSAIVRCAAHREVALFARCNALRLVHMVWKQRRTVRQNSGLREEASALATATLGAVISGMQGQEEEDSVDYDSDDGEPRGAVASAAVSCEILRDVVEELLDEGRADVDVGPLVELGLQASRLRKNLRELFNEDPNEFVAVHEDETAVNEPRHAAVGLLESLFELAPKQVASKLTSIRMEHASEGDIEALLWSTGCLLPTLEDSYGGVHNICASELMRSLDIWCEALAGQMRLDPFLHARLLWCIWLRVRRPEASSTHSERALVLRSMAEAAVASGGLLPCVGLHAAQAFSQILRREPDLMDGRGGMQAFVGLVGILSSSSPGTAHIPIQAIEVALDTAGGVPASAPCQDLVRYIIRLWSLGIRNDPMLSEACGRILLHVSRRVTDLLQQVSEASPSLAGQICRADIDGRLHAQARALFDGMHASMPHVDPDAQEDRLLCMADCLRVVSRVQPVDAANRLVWLRDQLPNDPSAYSAALVNCLRAARMSSIHNLLGLLGKDIVRFPCTADVLLEVALASLAVNDISWLAHLQEINWADLISFVISSGGRGDSPIGIVFGAFLCLVAKHAPNMWEDPSLKPFLQDCLTWSATPSEPDVEDQEDLWGFALPAELEADEEGKSEDLLLDAFDGNAQDYQVTLESAKAIIARHI
mmetsp:Transcript_23351/g.41163  ORF Transcript_23351/g.41163 Transcript_23351/m.41163 type:complete len:950 (+) Transcript_23351:21-2870(+)